MNYSKQPYNMLGMKKIAENSKNYGKQEETSYVNNRGVRKPNDQCFLFQMEVPDDQCCQMEIPPDQFCQFQMETPVLSNGDTY
jgi:hypothetical protein